MDDPAEASKARTVDFSSTTPLPPIGTKTDDEISDDSAKEDDNRSTASHPGTSRPAIIQKFRPESLIDDTDIEVEGRLLEAKEAQEEEAANLAAKRAEQKRPDIVDADDEDEDDDDQDKTTKVSSFIPIKCKRKTYDGREITMVTLDTQTDWDWVERSHLDVVNTLAPSDGKRTPCDLKDKSDMSPKSGSKIESLESKASPEISKFQQPYNDEYGIPILDLSSDTDDSSDEEFANRKVKDDRTFMPSVGPPNILQYQRESNKSDLQVDRPESRMLDDEYPSKSSERQDGIFSGLCEFCRHPVKPFPTMEQQLKHPPESLYCCNDYREFVEYVTSTDKAMEEEQTKRTRLINIKPHEHVGSKQERTAAKEKAVQRMRERELQRRQQEASGLQQNFFASAARIEVARQMKTINYQLSSQKCLEEGWTVRAPSPMLEDEDDDVFEPEPLRPEMIAEGKVRDRPLVEKYYEDGQKFLTMFPDGTGNVFYPSGNLAILITSVKLGQYYYTIHHDIPKSGLAAAFEPNGYGYCYFPNGDVRLYIDQYGGIELDPIGGRRRKWKWKGQITHVHAPPFQPICIGVNTNIGVRVMSQENITLTFSSSQRSCRFNMGSRLKLVAPENAPLKEVHEDTIFLEEKKTQVDILLNKVANLLKFPNNPKLDKMMPPLHVTSKQNKTEKLKKDRQVYLEQVSAREKKQASISVN